MEKITPTAGDNIFEVMEEFGRSNYCVEWWFKRDFGSDCVVQFTGTPRMIAEVVQQEKIEPDIDMHLLDRDLGLTMESRIWKLHAQSFLKKFEKSL